MVAHPRIAAVVGMTVTFVVYVIALRPILDLARHRQAHRHRLPLRGPADDDRSAG